MTVSRNNREEAEEKKQEEVETPEPGTPWVEGKEEDAGAMIKRVILVDMDNTLCDWEEAFERAMKEHYPEVPLVPRSQRISWDHAQDYPEEHREIVNKVCGTPGFFETMKENAGGIQALKDMVAEGNEVKIVSAPHPDYYAQCSAEKCKWVATHLGEDWLPRLVLTPDAQDSCPRTRLD